jgi:hypothetical protein
MYFHSRDPQAGAPVEFQIYFSEYAPKQQP